MYVSVRVFVRLGFQELSSLLSYLIQAFKCALLCVNGGCIFTQIQQTNKIHAVAIYAIVSLYS